MKKTLSLLILVFLIVGCKKIIYDDVAPQLEIIVKTESAENVFGATIKLYSSQEDWESDINVIQSGLTDNMGKILFTDLEEIKYFFEIIKDEMMNRQISEIINPLKKNVKAIINITIN